MTEKEAEFWIRRFEGGNEDDRYRASDELRIVMRLMLHSNIRIATICDLTVYSYRQRYYVTMRGGEYMYNFDVYDEDDEIVEAYIRKKKLKDNDYIIQVSKEALRKKFRHLVSVYYEGEEEERPELKDLYGAGIGREYKPMKRPKKTEE